VGSHNFNERYMRLRGLPIPGNEPRGGGAGGSSHSDDPDRQIEQNSGVQSSVRDEKDRERCADERRDSDFVNR